MGITGLHTYVKKKYDWKHRLTLDKNCSFVLDGNAVCYHIANRCELLWQYGGSYGVFKKSLQEFLQSLISACQSPLHIVFDGTDESGEKADTIIDRKKTKLDKTVAAVRNMDMGHADRGGPLLPLISEEFRSVISSFEQQGSIKVYVANGEADPVVVALANDLKSYVIGNDSDYYIYPIEKGYIPLDRLSDDMRTFQVYKWKEFRDSQGFLNLGLIILPAFIGNDVIEGLPEVGKNIYEVVSYLKKHAYSELKGRHSLSKLEDHLSVDSSLWKRYRENRKKAKSNYMYEELSSTAEYSDKYPGKTFDDKPIPDWMIKNFKHYKLANDLLEVLITPHPYLLHIVPDNPEQTSAKIFSRSIRQAMYGIMFKRRDVIEIIRKEECLEEEVVPAALLPPKVEALSIHKMTKTAEMNRISFLCYTLHCNDPESLTDAFELEMEWVLPVATLCYWLREAGISTDEVEFRALVLCFAILKYEQSASVDSSTLEFNVDTLHLYTQWQCVYYDALLLNQILALPLPATSPSSVFDGELVTCYSQMTSRKLDKCIRKTSQEVQNFFDKIVSFVQNN